MFPKVFSFLLPRREPEPLPESEAPADGFAELVRVMSVRRESIDDQHGPACVLNLCCGIPLDGHSPPLPSAAIFFGGNSASGPTLDFDTDFGRQRSTTYRAVVGDRVASAWVRAWRAHLHRHHLGAGTPTAADFLLGFDAALAAALFRGGKKLRDILEPHGLRLAFGVIRHDALLSDVTQGVRALIVDEFIREGTTGRMETHFVRVHATLVDAARRSVTRLKGHTRPPYFFAAVADSANLVHRLAIMPVHVRGKIMVFVDSDRERVVAGRKIAAGECFHKPTSTSELGMLANVHPELAWLGCVGPWPYRPDWIVLHRDDRRIEEQRGFRPNTIEGYDLHLALKQAVFTGSPYVEHARYLEIDGTVIGETDSNHPPIDWESASMRWWRIPPYLPPLLVSGGGIA